jgi:hypothetical protein
MRPALVAILLVQLAPAALADQVVIVREVRTAPEMPFSASVRLVDRIDGARLREESTMTLEAPSVDTLGNVLPKRQSEPEEGTFLWFPEERLWRTWGPKQGAYDESTEAEVAASLNDESMGGLEEFFGTRESLVDELEFTVDSTGAARTIAGLAARPYVMRGMVRFYELESNLGDSVRFVREAWVTPAIPGVGADAPRRELRPGGVMAKAMLGFQTLVLPVLKGALKRTDAEVARLPGHVLRDEFRLEPRPDAPADSATSIALYREEVTEIRREPPRPELFRVPAGMRKRVPQPPTIIESPAPRKAPRSPGKR